LSIRRLQPDPWHSTVADYKVGDVIEGTVTKLVNFGAFVRVRDGLEGLIHISELSQARVTHPSDVVREGQALKLKIISLDSERHRLGLSLKQAEEAPARPERERERRPRAPREYSTADAVQESEGGIDNTLAAAFAQVREQMAATEEARREAAPETENETEAETEAPVESSDSEAAAAETETPTAEGKLAVAEISPAEVVAPTVEAEASSPEAEAEPTAGADAPKPATRSKGVRKLGREKAAGSEETASPDAATATGSEETASPDAATAAG
ncbi:MAG TPA: S1 RNA-binding domain-containing protein, partial [Candidatus Limnocylindrales bacterium]|nr:S1 RNA-binding domain-containing protein [Candidatus Limnocylindrales bacterium]